MPALFKTWLDICLLRRSPQAAPAQAGALYTALLAYVLVSFFLLAAQAAGIVEILRNTALDVLLQGIWCWGLLQLRGRRRRFNQTLGALLGSGVYITLLAIPLTLVVQHAAPKGMALPYVEIALLLLLAWNALVMGHILRASLDVSMFTALGAAIFYTWFNVMVFSVWLPPVGTA